MIYFKSPWVKFDKLMRLELWEFWFWQIVRVVWFCFFGGLELVPFVGDIGYGAFGLLWIVFMRLAFDFEFWGSAMW
ncbi:hypothetical protein, partial [Rhizobium brockwellii]|uniref:hypothetical protein n=1 Tax=Rhizobium brockwellii TaxID=3019932 RepID=UPI003F98CF25